MSYATTRKRSREMHEPYELAEGAHEARLRGKPPCTRRTLPKDGC